MVLNAYMIYVCLLLVNPENRHDKKKIQCTEQTELNHTDLWTNRVMQEEEEET